MNFSDAMNYINSFSHSGKKVEDLSRISGLLSLLDNPQDKLKYVHIAGTNGKGSVSTAMSYILKDAGYKTGLYTLPKRDGGLFKKDDRLFLKHHRLFFKRGRVSSKTRSRFK